jgi:cyclopropane fatty-acyl-phospholipid synthase-like methyltransferase
MACFALTALVAAQAPHEHEHEFSDSERWAQVFDDPKRDHWQKPQEVIDVLALKPDAVVADIGAGTGYFSVRLARALKSGKVYAIDLEPDMVKHLAARAKRDQLANMLAVQAAGDDARLPERVDLALLVDTYHHIDDRRRYFARLKDSLKAGGRVAIIDFTLDSDIGPPPRARVSPERVKSELAGAGYRLTEEHTFLENQYFLVFMP